MTAVDVDALDATRAAAKIVARRWLTDGVDAEVDSHALVADIAAALEPLLAEVRRGRARDEVLKKLIAAAPVVWNGDYPIKAVPLSDLLSLDALAATDGTP